ncbi:lipopolysaccharide biosynthesis protein [Croceicoccus bisphenolivorans]|uniref:lipopolysaccharide biosynthesis protein n=1 Tax=Croceicoccus bisphenolivorans TaxID=1783232 RepID=UPI00083649D6|nr:hypothetical protein [Croceicoccus bisphenolivorans]
MSRSGLDRGRLLRGIAANMFTFVTRIGVQVITMPLLFAFWTTPQVGVWLMLQALPAYLSLTAGGFGAAGGNAAIAAHEAGDTEEAKALFVSTWVAVTLTNLLLIAAFFVSSGLVLDEGMILASGIAGDQILAAIGWLCVFVFLTVQTSAIDVAFRYAGRYPLSMTIKGVQTIGEIAATAIVVATSQRLSDLPMALALVRAATFFISLVIARNVAGELFGGVGPKRIWATVKRIGRPSIAFMAAPLVFGFNIQGYTLLVGAFFGPVVVATFVAIRTLARLIDMATNFVFQLAFFEMAHLQSAGLELQRRIFASLTLGMVVIVVGYFAGFLALGPWAQHIWTHGETEFSYPIAIVLALAGSVRSLTLPAAAVLSAANRNAAFMASYLVISALAFGGAFLLTQAGMPLHIILLPLVVAELGQAIPAIRMTLMRLSYRPTALLRDVLSIRTRLRDFAVLRG